MKPYLFSFFKFYPENREEFIKIFKENFDGFNYKSEFVGDPKIIISPHATYLYSGKVAARAFNLIRSKEPKLIIILGPPHYKYFHGFAVYNGDYLRSPLGDIKISMKEVSEIKKKIYSAFLNKRMFYREHSINIELPYIQATFKNTKILPIIIGDTKRKELKYMAKYLMKVLKRKNTMLLVSTDLSHYHKLNIAKEIDENTIRILEEKRGDAFLRFRNFDKVEACGWRALYIAMLIAKKMKLKFFPVSRGYSSDYDGNRQRVVGYFSGIYYKEEKLEISGEEKREIIKIVKNSILKENFKKEKVRPTEILNRKMGVFITLKKDKKLRGCMGQLFSDAPLYKSLKNIAILSAYKDPRFPPLKAKEIENLEITVSLIFNFRQLYNVKDLDMGKDGLLIINGDKKGVLLPEIPIIYRWGRNEFLKNTCIKAKLPEKCWKDKNTSIYVFNTYSFTFSLE